MLIGTIKAVGTENTPSKTILFGIVCWNQSHTHPLHWFALNTASG
jgi:hypothetical protein